MFELWLKSTNRFETLSFFSYLLVGAAIFDALESDREDYLRKQYQATEATMLSSYNISDDDYQELEEIVIKYHPHKAGAQWKFPGAFYFSLTVITTIGKLFYLRGHSNKFDKKNSFVCINQNISRVYVNCIFMHSKRRRRRRKKLTIGSLSLSLLFPSSVFFYCFGNTKRNRLHCVLSLTLILFLTLIEEFFLLPIVFYAFLLLLAS